MPSINPGPYADKLFNFLSLRVLLRKKPQPVSPQGFPYATLNRRMMASVIDAAILSLAILPFNDWIMAFVSRDMMIDAHLLEEAARTAQSQAEYNQRVTLLMIEAGLGKALVALMQIQYAVMAAFSFLFWHFYAATPGKLLLRMRIVDVNTGAAITDRQSMIRIIGYFISSVPLMLGFFAISWNPRRQAWHDRMAGTAVVVLPVSLLAKKEKDAATPAPAPAGPSDSPAPEAKE